MSKPPPTSTNTQAAAPTANLNPLSKFQERVEVPGLTLYEVHREPRRENCKQALCKMELETLGSEFRCPVCLGYIKNATLVKECLHRFCCECIQKCLRTQKKKECPTCRVHIPSRRSLRPDAKFDALIASIYGDVNEIEKYEYDQNKKINEKNISNAYAESRKLGIQYQAEQRVSRDISE
jgi:E3 ubiquitin-protein ligase RNF1/2